ncbi:dipeptide/oligopeptide/nickel ABC transporter ATP-binding protein [Sphaerisporangium krabiense]|uniref:Peptide/nickel transport system ATP-binding protein n=1 Tax=Sphaerisporangium krabiense TaxID=763782 RepID=A0A7W9DU20_9ACTN|nr:ABC transporter ATP-binding protein [Sphaerisporangium krabiense]MBB5630654.1 peptide/nickel transport system ATP-binding protein [Sphaerisporangium krabiense]GII62390.1 dipeptide/oligopeptide/nickel ABC transporter ATP-binding protein [Sphaerisporangium krabiense]
MNAHVPPAGASRPHAHAREAAAPLLEVTGLCVSFGAVRVVDGVSFGVRQGRTLGIVGESGSGKSVSSLAVLGLHRTASVTGSIVFDGEELVGAPAERLRTLRGSRMSMIFQDPLSSLHPCYTVGEQIAESYRLHRRASRRAARERAVEMLAEVGIPEPRRRAREYPHRFSGGMRQRVMIAMALACEPNLLIADEPTTALDVTVQAQILELIARIQEERGLAVIMITHDLGVVAQVADDVLVMYGGRTAEYAGARALFKTPRHPYTQGLLASVPGTAWVDADGGERLPAIAGAPPSPMTPPPGCRFHPRCSRFADARRPAVCATERPGLSGAGHKVACHFPEGAQ